MRCVSLTSTQGGASMLLVMGARSSKGEPAAMVAVMERRRRRRRMGRPRADMGGEGKGPQEKVREGGVTHAGSREEVAG